MKSPLAALVSTLTAPPGGLGQPVTMAACRIVTVSPLTIDFHDAPTYPAQKIAGLTYTVGEGLALLTPGAVPVVLPL